MQASGRKIIYVRNSRSQVSITRSVVKACINELSLCVHGRFAYERINYYLRRQNREIEIYGNRPAVRECFKEFR